MKKIYSLNDIKPDHRPIIEQAIVNSGIYKKPNDKFDGYGLRYDVEYLNRIGGAIIIFPLEFMADYVDIVTKGYIDDNDTDFIIGQTNHLRDNISSFDKANTTALGNIAYVCLHCKNEDARSVSYKYLEGYFDYFLNKFSNSRKYSYLVKIIQRLFSNELPN